MSNGSESPLSPLPKEGQQEGKAQFVVGDAFFRQHSQVGRDLAVLVAALEKADRGHLRVLDAMTGCGVRSLRYGLEAEADWIWANEGNPEMGELLHYNLSSQLQPQQFQITHQEANHVFFDCHIRRDFYDLVDVDSFGSAAPYVTTSLWAVKLGGLVYLTDTDGRSRSGHNPVRSLAAYGTYPRLHPAFTEQGLRLLIGAAWQHAASKGLSIQPIFSLFHQDICRVMLRLLPTFDQQIQVYGFIAYCHDCGHYRTIKWRQLSRAQCPHHAEPQPMVVSGPLWLGALHHRPTIQRMQQLATDWNWTERAKLLQIMADEADLPPWFFRLAEIGRRTKRNIPNRDRMIAALCDRGFSASQSHIDPQAIKTTATFQDCIAIAAEL